MDAYKINLLITLCIVAWYIKCDWPLFSSLEPADQKRILNMNEMLDDRDGAIKQPHEPASTQRQTLPECPLFTLEIAPTLRN